MTEPPNEPPDRFGELCLNGLLSSALPSSWRHRRTVGQVLQEAIGAPRTDAARELTACGIRVDYRPGGGGGYWVLIANRNSQLEVIFAGSRWAGIWNRALCRIPGAERGGPARFGASVSRFVAVPLSVRGLRIARMRQSNEKRNAAAKRKEGWISRDVAQ